MSKKTFKGKKPKLSSVKNKISSITTDDAKKTVLQKIEKLKTNASLIVFSLLLVIVILFFYYNSKGYKVNKALTRIAKYKLYVITGTELNNAENREKKLCDFYVSCAYKPYMVDNQYFGYCSIEVMKAILYAGVRCVYVDVFNSNMTDDAYPVVSSGYMEGEWKLAFNSIDFKEMCLLIKNIVFSSGYINNYGDPFILCLNLKTNGNYKCLNKVKKILYEVFGSKLLDNTYTYSSKYVMTEPIKNLMGKMIIFSSSGYENSDLEELINYSWDKSGFKKISYESLDIESNNSAVVKLDNSELKNFNMNGITLVTPNENTIFTYNYNANYGWDSGSQFVFLNFQYLDENMSNYIEKFQMLSFISKPNKMISGSKKEEIKLKVNKDIKSVNNNVKEQLSCPEKPSENYDALMGDEMLFYKDNVSDGLGLCYGIEKGDKCNCTFKGCDDSLWSEHEVRKRGNIDFKLCCSTRRINDPSIKINPYNEAQKSSQKYFFSNNCIPEVASQAGTKDFLALNLESGKNNFESNIVNRVSTNNLHKCKFDYISEMENNKVCLMNLTDGKKLCPDGWTYNGKLDTETYNGKNLNICCKNL